MSDLPYLPGPSTGTNHNTPASPTTSALTRDQAELLVQQIWDLNDQASGEALLDHDAAQRLTIERLERELAAIQDTVGDTEFSLRQQLAAITTERAQAQATITELCGSVNLAARGIVRLTDERDAAITQQQAWQIALAGLERQHKALTDQIPSEMIQADPILLERAQTAAALEVIGREQIAQLQARVTELEDARDHAATAWNLYVEEQAAEKSQLQATLAEREQVIARLKDYEKCCASLIFFLGSVYSLPGEGANLTRRNL